MKRVPFWFDLPLLQDISDVFSSPPLHFLKAFQNSPSWFHDSLMGHLPWFGKHWPIPGVSDSLAHRLRPFKQNRQRKRIPGLHPRPPATDRLLVKPRHCRSNNLPRRFWCALKSENFSLDPYLVMRHKGSRSKGATYFFKVTLLIGSKANHRDPCLLYCLLHLCV